jgi:hypothetical protein
MNQFHEGFQDIMDERYAAVDVLGKGLVIFSALSDFNLYENVSPYSLEIVARMRVS